MALIALRQVGARIDHGYSHSLHMPLYCLAIDADAFISEHISDTARPVIRQECVDFINSAPNVEDSFGYFSRLVVQTSPINA